MVHLNFAGANLLFGGTFSYCCYRVGFDSHAERDITSRRYCVSFHLFFPEQNSRDKVRAGTRLPCFQSVVAKY